MFYVCIVSRGYNLHCIVKTYFVKEKKTQFDPSVNASSAHSFRIR